mmetsp:Transcript_3255/g.6046  ORF Transcript_3255/g.6046 Transcript_3255/m.6046 type:complete len:2350 (+) Transcript_3255:179-7228(+)
MGQFASPVFWQVQFLVETLGKKNYKTSCGELQDITQLYGMEAEIFALSCLFNEVDLDAVNETTVQQGQVNVDKQSKIGLLCDKVKELWDKGAQKFGTNMANALDGAVRLAKAKTPSQQQGRLLAINAVQVEILCSKVLKLSTAQQLCVGVGISESVENNVSNEGAKLLVTTLFNNADLTPEEGDKVDESVVSRVVCVLRSHPVFLADAELGNSCMLALQNALPDSFDKVEVAPFLVPGSLYVDLLPSSGASKHAAGEKGAVTKSVVAALGIDKIMKDLGPECTSSVNKLKNILQPILKQRNKKLDDSDVSRVIGMMMGTQSFFLGGGAKQLSGNVVNALHEEFAGLELGSSKSSSSSTKGWDVAIFIQVAKQLCSAPIDADKILRKLGDRCEEMSFKTVDKTAFNLVVNAYKLMKGGNGPVPGLLFLDITDLPGRLWQNKSAQMGLLFHAINAPVEDVKFSTMGTRRPVVSVPKGVARCANLAWESLDLVATVDAMAGSGFYEQAKSLVETAINAHPELVLVGLLQVDSPFDSLREEIYALLLPKFLQSIHQKVEPAAPKLATVKLIWDLNQSVLLRALVAMYARDAKFLPFIVEIVVRLQQDGINRLLNLPMPRLVFDVACFAARMEPSPLLNLDQWLTEKIGQQKDVAAMARTLLSFLQLKLASPVPPQQSQNIGVPLGAAEFVIIFKKLQELVQKRVVSNEFAQELNHAYEKYNLKMTRGQQQQAGGNSPVPSNQRDGSQQGSSSAPPEYVEQQANAYFQMIYKSKKSTPEIIEMLTRFKNSDNPLENDIFNCMVHNLLDEYRFLHKYPDKELQITGVLFGALIQHQLVESIALGIALRYILEALRKPITSPMFRFGIFALEQFKSRLPEWPQTCTQITQIPHVRENYPSLVREIEAGNPHNKNLRTGSAFPNSGREPSVSPSLLSQNRPPLQQQQQQQQFGAYGQQGSLASQISFAVGKVGANPAGKGDFPQPSYPLRGTERTEELHAAFGACLDKLVAEPPNQQADIPSPGGDVEDNIHFVINNLTQRNMQEKVQMAKQVLKPEHFSWVAYYLVVKRVSTQANFHVVYMTFLEMLNEKQLFEQVRFRTLATVRKLLRSNDIVSSTTERSLLKNLGSWLGKLTLARNLPLLHREVDLKGLLCDGYERGWLIAVVPFVAKVLDGTKGSKAFGPKNPWLVGLLRTLAELYQLVDLKLNLKFEIEVLCKNLSIDLKTIKPSVLLPTRRKPQLESNPDFNVKISATPKPRPDMAGSEAGGSTPPSPGLHVQSGAQQQLRPPQAKREEGKGAAANAIPEHTVIPNLAAYVCINPNLQLFIQQPGLRRVVPVAVDRAIREIIQPVVERSVTIACITSRELILKDFAMEPDEKKMRKAAHLMVSNLAGALALVTCKEPLRVSIGNHLRSLLSQTSAREEQPNLLEQVVQICSSENLELGCMLIEKAATEKAMRDIDDQIEHALTVRIESREQHNTPYFDVSVFQTGNKYPKALPDHLRPSPNPNGLAQHQLLVYEAFQRIPKQPVVPPSRSSVGSANPGAVAGPPKLGGGVSGQPHQGLPPQQQPSPHASPVSGGNLTAAQALEKLRVCFTQLDRLLMDIGTQTPNLRALSIARLPRDHEILLLLREIRSIVVSTQPAQRDEPVMRMSQHLFKRLYDIPAGDKLPLETLLAALEIFRDLPKDLALFKKNLTDWVIMAPQEHKLNRAVTIGLIKGKLINVHDFDVYLSKLLEMGRQVRAVGFAMDIIQECIVVNRYIQLTDLLNTLDTLQKILLRMKQSPIGAGGSNPAQRPEFNGLQQLLDNVRLVANSEQQQQPMVPGLFLRANDPQGLRQQVAQLLHAWIQLCGRPDGATHEAVHRPYLSLLQQQGALKGDENANRFFRITTELCIESSLTQNSGGYDNAAQTNRGVKRNLSYVAIDAFAKLVVLLVKYAEVRARTSLLSMVLDVVSGVLCREYLLRKQRGVESSLDQRPYFRLFLNLQQDLADSYEAEGLAEEHTLSMLSAFAGVYQRVLQPNQLPGFAFAWLELVSHKSFMPKLLRSKDRKGWLILECLLVDIFRFLHPFLKEAQLSPSVRILYKGMLRVLLVLLHDFPEFLCSFHFSLCDAVPPSCIQLRNLILSAFPRSMQLPDPFTPNLKVELLAETSKPPSILSNYTLALQEAGIRQELDNYLKTGQPATFPADLKELLVTFNGTTGKRDYKTSLINAVVLYVGVFSIAQFKSTGPANLPLMQKIMQSGSMPATSLYEYLVTELDAEGRYLLLNAIANQLRFPSTHTYYFSCLLLYLFSEGWTDIIREQMTRVLLERLIVHRPHPWGLLITFIELIKNPGYRFWDYSFTQCAPEINRLFESVAR